MSQEPRTLEQMARRLTAYEVVAKHDNGTENRLAFTERKTKAVLLSIAQQNSETVLSMLGSWDGEASYSAATGWTFGPVAIRFSGRTERDLASL